MKSDIHPLQKPVLAKCVCNNEFYFYSSMESDIINIELCNKCHRNDKHRVANTARGIEKFNARYEEFRDKIVKSTITKAAVGAPKATVSAPKATVGSAKVTVSAPKATKSNNVAKKSIGAIQNTKKALIGEQDTKKE